MTESTFYAGASVEETLTTMTALATPAIQHSVGLLQSLGGNYDPLTLSRHIAEATAELIAFLTAERSVEEFLAFSKLLADPEVIEAYIDEHTDTPDIQEMRLSVWERITGKVMIPLPKKPEKVSGSVTGLETYSQTYNEFQNAFRERRAKVQQSAEIDQKILNAQAGLKELEDAIEKKQAEKETILGQKRQELAALRKEASEVSLGLNERKQEIATLLSQGTELKEALVEPFKELWGAHLAKTTEAYLESFSEHLRGEVRQLITGTHGPSNLRKSMLSRKEIAVFDKAF